MKCIKCGTELSEGMAFCPSCGAAQNTSQNAGNESFGNSQQPQQQWQSQQSYGQQQYNQQPQQNQGWNQNNLQGMAGMQKKKSSKTPLIIGLVAAVIIIIGLAVTCIILITSKDSSSKNNINNSNSNGNSVSKASTAEDTVKAFLEALIDGDYSKASEYVLSGDVDYLEFGDVDLSKSALKRNYQDLTGYEVGETEKFNKNELQKLNDYLDYSEEITDAIMVGVYFIYDYDDYDDVAVFVVKTDKWYVLAIDN